MKKKLTKSKLRSIIKEVMREIILESEQKIKNPDTGRMIKVSSALSYPKDSSVYKRALKATKGKSIEPKHKRVKDSTYDKDDIEDKAGLKTLSGDIEDDGVDYTLTAGIGVDSIADPKLKKMAKTYLRVRNYFTDYLDKHKDKDPNYEDLIYTIEEDGLEAALKQGFSSSDFSDRKFKKIWKLMKNSMGEIESYVGKAADND